LKKKKEDQKPKDITAIPSPWTEPSVHSKQNSKVFRYLAWFGWILGAIVLIWVLFIV